MKPGKKPKEWAKAKAEIFDKAFSIAHPRIKGAVKLPVHNAADDLQAALLEKALTRHDETKQQDS